jgi:hypothetical protein
MKRRLLTAFINWTLGHLHPRKVFLEKIEGTGSLCGMGFRYRSQRTRSIWFGFSLTVEMNYIHGIKTCVKGVQKAM